MSDVIQEVRRISWSECFSFTHLFRAFRLAIHPTKLMLAFCGILLTYGTGRTLDRIWPSSHSPAIGVVDGQVASELDFFVQPRTGGLAATRVWLEGLGSANERDHIGTFASLLEHGRATIKGTTDAVMRVDCGGICTAAKSGVMGVVWVFRMHPLYGILFFLAALVIWSYFGGAICRVAAMHAARDERLGLRESLSFAHKKIGSLVAAPLMPLAILALFAVLLVLGGLVGAIPAVGEIAVGVLLPLALIAGFVMAFVVIGAAAGFSLTFPTIAVEGSDAFDALSRSFSYIYQRPWRSAFYGFLSVVYGAICLLFVKFLARIMLCTVHMIVGLSMNLGNAYVTEDAAGAGGDVPKLDALWEGPSLASESAFWGSFPDNDLAHVSKAGRALFCMWIFSVVGLVGAFVVSFYYSASTLIYFMLRREVDATDLEDVYLEEEPEPTTEARALPADETPASAESPASPPTPESAAPSGDAPSDEAEDTRPTDAG